MHLRGWKRKGKCEWRSKGCRYLCGSVEWGRVSGSCCEGGQSEWGRYPGEWARWRERFCEEFYLGPASMPVVPDSDVGFVATFSLRSSLLDSDEEEDSEPSESLLALPEGLLPPADAARPAAGAPRLGGAVRVIAGAPGSAAEEVNPLGKLRRCCCCRRRSEVPAASAPKAADVACGTSMTTGLTAGSP